MIFLTGTDHIQSRVLMIFLMGTADILVDTYDLSQGYWYQ